jgi:hypothetical protein
MILIKMEYNVLEVVYTLIFKGKIRIKKLTHSVNDIRFAFKQKMTFILKHFFYYSI